MVRRRAATIAVTLLAEARGDHQTRLAGNVERHHFNACTTFRRPLGELKGATPALRRRSTSGLVLRLSPTTSILSPGERAADGLDDIRGQVGAANAVLGGQRCAECARFRGEHGVGIVRRAGDLKPCGHLLQHVPRHGLPRRFPGLRLRP
jgi:hypothetical protein